MCGGGAERERSECGEREQRGKGVSVERGAERERSECGEGEQRGKGVSVWRGSREGEE